MIALAPAIWFRLVWPSEPSGGVAWWAIVFAVSMLPFALLALLRRIDVIRGTVALAAFVLSGALVVLGQALGLNPNDPSSTASIALVVFPIYACVAVGLLAAAAGIARAVKQRTHGTQLPH